MKAFFVSLLLSSATVAAPAVEPVDPSRAYLDKLKTERQVAFDDYDSPFLIAQVSRATDLSFAAETARLSKFLKKGALPFRGHFAKSGPAIPSLGTKGLPLPQILLEGKQLEGIKNCSPDYCLMKLNDREKGLMQKAKDKVATFHQLVIDRIISFYRENQLLGYEGRHSDIEYFRKIISKLGFLSARYPVAAAYLSHGFWDKQAAPKELTDSFFRQETVNLSHDKLQPIWRVGEVLEFREKDSTLFAEIYVYSNHFLDSSARFYEVIPLGKKSAVIVTDAMEVDELTKSALVRMLYVGQMQKAVMQVQREELDAMQGRRR